MKGVNCTPLTRGELYTPVAALGVNCTLPTKGELYTLGEGPGRKKERNAITHILSKSARRPYLVSSVKRKF